MPHLMNRHLLLILQIMILLGVFSTLAVAQESGLDIRSAMKVERPIPIYPAEHVNVPLPPGMVIKKAQTPQQQEVPDTLILQKAPMPKKREPRDAIRLYRPLSQPGLSNSYAQTIRSLDVPFQYNLIDEEAYSRMKYELRNQWRTDAGIYSAKPLSYSYTIDTGAYPR